MMKNFSLFAFLSIITLFACQEKSKPLPVYGHVTIENGDTSYHTVPDFSFINQDSQVVTKATFKDKTYIADYFFIHCPTICPKVKKNMKRIYDHYLEDNRVLLLSHSVDYRNDTIPALKKYATRLGVKTSKWHFVTGDPREIYDIADEYFVANPKEDPDAPGGYDHDGKIVLVDAQGRIRAHALGTDADEVDKLIKSIQQLLDQEY